MATDYSARGQAVGEIQQPQEQSILIQNNSCNHEEHGLLRGHLCRTISRRPSGIAALVGACSNATKLSR